MTLQADPMAGQLDLTEYSPPMSIEEVADLWAEKMAEHSRKTHIVELVVAAFPPCQQHAVLIATISVGAGVSFREVAASSKAVDAMKARFADVFVSVGEL